MISFEVRVPDDGSIVAIDHLVLEEGLVTVLFGPNGAGKSTVLRHLAGMGSDPRLECAYQPQAPYLFRGLAGTNLGLGLSSEEAAHAGTIAAELGIRDLLAEPSETLSGGERQRLVLARTLAKRAEWVLLDEPLNAISLRDRTLVLEVLAGNLSERSAVVVTHDLDVAAALADRVAVMEGGRLLQSGPLPEVLRSPASVEVARVFGVGNVIEGKGTADAGFTVVSAGAVDVLGTGSIDGPARAIIPATGVVLGPPASLGTSERNRWSGPVSELRRGATVVEVVVDIGVPLVSVITPGAADELGLEVGSEVSASVKAASVTIVPA